MARLRLRIAKIRKLCFLFVSALGLHYLCTMNYLEVFGTLVGLVYLWLEYRASIYLWLACIVMPAVYLVVYYQARAVCRFRNQRVLPAGFSIWLDSLEQRKEKEEHTAD